MNLSEYGYIVPSDPMEVFGTDYGYTFPECRREACFLSAAATAGGAAGIPGLSALGGPVGLAIGGAIEGVDLLHNWLSAGPTAAQKSAFNTTINSSDQSEANTWESLAKSSQSQYSGLSPEQAEQQINQQYQQFMGKINDSTSSPFMTAAQKAAQLTGLKAAYDKAMSIIKGGKSSTPQSSTGGVTEESPAGTPNASGSTVTGIGKYAPLIAGAGLLGAGTLFGKGGGKGGASSGNISAVGDQANTVAMSDVLNSVGKLQNLTMPEYEAFIKYLNDLTSSDPTQRMAAVAPAAQDISSQTTAAEKSIRDKTQRGGEQDYLIANAETNKAANIGNLLAGEYTKAQEEKGQVGQTGVSDYLAGIGTFGNLEQEAAAILGGQQDRSAAGTESTLSTLAQLAFLASSGFGSN